jgi:hypothetical protein
MTTPIDSTNHWPLHGDPTRLSAAAAVLRTVDAEQVFGTRFPGEYVMASVARLLETLAYKIHEHVELGHDVVSAATDIAEHVLAYVPMDRRGSGDVAHQAPSPGPGRCPERVALRAAQTRGPWMSPDRLTRPRGDRPVISLRDEVSALPPSTTGCPAYVLITCLLRTPYSPSRRGSAP